MKQIIQHYDTLNMIGNTIASIIIFGMIVTALVFFATTPSNEHICRHQTYSSFDRCMQDMR